MRKALWPARKKKKGSAAAGAWSVPEEEAMDWRTDTAQEGRLELLDIRGLGAWSVEHRRGPGSLVKGSVLTHDGLVTVATPNCQDLVGREVRSLLATQQIMLRPIVMPERPVATPRETVSYPARERDLPPALPEVEAAAYPPKTVAQREFERPLPAEVVLPKVERAEPVVEKPTGRIIRDLTLLLHAEETLHELSGKMLGDGRVEEAALLEKAAIVVHTQREQTHEREAERAR